MLVIALYFSSSLWRRYQAIAITTACSLLGKKEYQAVMENTAYMSKELSERPKQA